MPIARLLIVDDSEAFVRGLEAILAGEGNFSVAGVARNMKEALDVAREVQPDVALVDLRIRASFLDTQADFSHGLELIRLLRRGMPALRILAMSFSNDTRWPVLAVQSGAHGFLSKDASPEEIIAALHRVISGGVVLTAEQLEQLLHVPELSGLTAREQEVLRLLAQRMSNPEIARTLGISVGTVRTHVANILAKLNVHSRREAVEIARRKGWL